ncbi:MAG: CocE/NonD family hydrolase, partial [Geminicoccales bacterium]
MSSAIRVIEHLWIPLDGGRRLAARLWLPALDAPAPAIFEYLPYRKRDGTAPRDATTFPVFAESGYAGIRVDIAGTGDSDELFDDEYSERELSDGEAVIDWIAHQPWCDGNVGMIGISWGGFSGLQLAFRRPPALKAIVTACSTTDRYLDDTHFMDGCLL